MNTLKCYLVSYQSYKLKNMIIFICINIFEKGFLLFRVFDSKQLICIQKSSLSKLLDYPFQQTCFRGVKALQ